MGRAHRLFEHRNQCARDVRRAARGIKEVGRSTRLKIWGNVRNVIVGVDVFAVGKGGWVLDRFIRNVKNCDRYATVLESGAK